MRFCLFSKVWFEVSDPIALIESYCFQSDFYGNYDLLLLKGKRCAKDVGAIGARMEEKTLEDCMGVIGEETDLPMFNLDLDGFLALNDRLIDENVQKLYSRVIEKLLRIRGVRLSTATKVLHTLYPENIPIIDRNLQDTYAKIVPYHCVSKPYMIFLDYYINLKMEENCRNLSQLFAHVSKNLPCLTKISVFDILWWSYLKAMRLKTAHKIDWSTIKELTPAFSPSASQTL